MGFPSSDTSSSSSPSKGKRRSSVAAAAAIFNKLAGDSSGSLGFSPLGSKSRLYASVSDMPLMDDDDDDDIDTTKASTSNANSNDKNNTKKERGPPSHRRAMSTPRSKGGAMPPRGLSPNRPPVSPAVETKSSSDDNLPLWKRKLMDQKSKGRSYSVKGDSGRGGTGGGGRPSTSSTAPKHRFMSVPLGARAPQSYKTLSDDELSDDDDDDDDDEKKKGSKEKGLEDVKIQVKINPALQEKLRELQNLRSGPTTMGNNSSDQKDIEFVPEHIRRFRAREAKLQAEHAAKEAARMAALDVKVQKAEQVVFAYVLGYYHRKRYPKLKAAYVKRMRERAKQARLEAVRHASATKIQAMARRYHPRKNFKRHWAGMLNRIRTKQRIKKIQMQVELIGRQTKSELAAMEKEYHDQNSAFQKALRKKVKAEIKEHEEKIKSIKNEGHSEIEYIKAENRRIREEMIVIHKDTGLLTKQGTVLEGKAAKVAEQFQSLQKWCDKKMESNQKKQMAESKCRNRYLPKYRRDLAQRNQKCIAESRVKELNKKCIYKIVDELQRRSTDPDVTSEIVSMILETERELEETLGEYDVPEELQKWLDWY
jgi:hypothetical protein